MDNREKALNVISNRSSRFREKQEVVFGENAFDTPVQKKVLPQEIFLKLQQTVKMGEALDPSVAEKVAQGMKEWALQKGVTHYCHWFQPLTDRTAQKHDSMFQVSGEEMMADFTGKTLIQGEPDASSFPSGGLRTTFEARGYTAWDPSSPAFVSGRTLYIPSIFLGWTGEVLDKKVPLIRSMDVLNTQALRILALFGDHETERVIPTVGAEQEYFLIDEAFYHLRPDLVCCGRTLFGARPPKGQELEDQYLGSIHERILAFMEETEIELMRLGISVKTRHNEVAPSQYELALAFGAANVMADQHMVVMDVLSRTALRHKLVCLLHEKPFYGINGSGKHTNWSLATNRGKNLLDPGHTPHENAKFLLFCAAVVRAVHKYSPQLRMTIATAGNDHRLGMHEAPPAILSVFLGEQLFDIFKKLIDGKVIENKAASEILLGALRLPKVPRHTSDRNRTSPFAFTGNKFEFRAVGSSQNISRAVTVLNTIVAESLDYFASELEKEGEFQPALQKLLSKVSQEFQPVLFEGNNYSLEWHKEAEKRGLPNFSNCVDALLNFSSAETVALFTKYKIYSRRELAARQEIELEKYIKKIHIEAKCASSLVHTSILPAVFAYGKELGEALVNFGSNEQDLIKNLAKEVGTTRKALKALDDELVRETTLPHDPAERAVFARDHIFKAMQELRRTVDHLEEMVGDRHWPLPKYREMLFIH